jgi:hypothetical protein
MGEAPRLSQAGALCAGSGKGYGSSRPARRRPAGGVGPWSSSPRSRAWSSWCSAPLGSGPQFVAGLLQNLGAGSVGAGPVQLGGVGSGRASRSGGEPALGLPRSGRVRTAQPHPAQHPQACRGAKRRPGRPRARPPRSGWASTQASGPQWAPSPATLCLRSSITDTLSTTRAGRRDGTGAVEAITVSR